MRLVILSNVETEEIPSTEHYRECSSCSLPPPRFQNSDCLLKTP